MSVEESDKVSDLGSKEATKSESASREAQAGKAELADAAKQIYRDLKDGVIRSGISDLFGKPDITDSNLQKLGKAGEASANHVLSGDAANEAVKALKGVKPEDLVQAGGPKELDQATGKYEQAGKGDQKDPGAKDVVVQKDEPGIEPGSKDVVVQKDEPGVEPGSKDVVVQKDEPGVEPGSKDVVVQKDEPGILDRLKNLDPEMVTMQARPVIPDKTTDASKPADKAQEKSPEVDAQSNEANAQKILDAKLPMSPEQEAQFRKDTAEIDKLPEAQRKKIYESLDKIANADTKDTTKLTPEQRAELVASVTHQIAHPEDIKQGKKDTCVAANVEKTIAMTHPEQYAQMAADLATKGEYTTPDGKTKMTAQRDADGKLAELSDPTGKRSGASEVLQTAITNVGMKDEGEYRSYKPKDDKDSGERVKDKDGKEKPFEGLPRDAKEDILAKLCPEDQYKARRIQNAEDLGQAWKDNGGKAPLNVTVRINADHTGMGSAKDGSAGTHAVTITHMEFGPDGKPTQIYYENTADSTDHSYPNGKPVPADDFVKSMQAERNNTYQTDGKTDYWSEPMTATVRTDGQEDRQGKMDKAKNEELDKAVAEFRDSTHKDAFFFDYGTDYDEMKNSLKDRPRWEVEEINKRYKEKYGHTLEEEIVDETSGKTRGQMRKLLKGSDTTTVEPVKR